MAVTSGHLKWEPKGGQSVTFADDPPRPVHDDILLAKLRPGQVSPVILTPSLQRYAHTNGRLGSSDGITLREEHRQRTREMVARR
jgi:hypothetical protein